MLLNFDEVKAKGYDVRVHIWIGLLFYGLDLFLYYYFNLSSVVLMKCVKSWLLLRFWGLVKDERNVKLWLVFVIV